MIDAECTEGNPEGLQLLRESLRKVQVKNSSYFFRKINQRFKGSGDVIPHYVFPFNHCLIKNELDPSFSSMKNV